MRKLFTTMLGVIAFFAITSAQNPENLTIQERMRLNIDFKKEFRNGDYMQNPAATFSGSAKGITDFGDAPDVNWFQQYGGSGNDYVKAVTTDPDGNVYITGSFSGEISFGANTYTATGLSEAFVAKLSNSGELLWLTPIAAQAGETSYSNDICISANNTIYIAGYFSGSIEIAGNAFVSGNEFAAFYAQFDTDGNALAGNYHSVNFFEAGAFIDVDPNGNVYMTIENSTALNSSSSSWIVKYDSDDNLLIEKEFDEGFFDFAITDNAIYFSGTMQNFNDGYLDDNVTLPAIISYGDVFVAKSDLDVNFEWGFVASHTEGVNGDSMIPHIKTDADNNFYLAAFFRNNIAFGDFELYNTGHFMAKFDATGNCLWLNSINSDANISDIAIDTYGNSYLTNQDVLAKFSPDGTTEYEIETAYPVYAILVGNDKFYTAGTNHQTIAVSQLTSGMSNEWDAFFGGNSATAYMIGMVDDNEQYIYTYSYASEAIDYLGTEVNKGVFVTKQNYAGEVLWLKQFESEQIEYGSQGNFINIDKENGFLYITGGFLGEFVLPDGTILTSENSRVFIVKMDVNGTLIWSKKEDINSLDPSIVPDNNGNVILSGTFDTECTISGTSLTSFGSNDGYIAKYDADGNIVWVKQAGGEDIEYNAIVSCDAGGNIYFSGEFISVNVTVGDGAITLADGDGHILYAKLNPEGEVQWIKSFCNAIEPGNYSEHYCWPTGIITTDDGYTYMKGWQGGNVAFDNFELICPYSYYSKFIAKINPDGDAVWAKSIEEEAYGFDYNQFDFDSEGSVYTGLSAQAPVHFEDDYTFETYESGLFVAKYDIDGELQWVKTMQGDNYTWISSVAVLSPDQIAVGGYFVGNLQAQDEIYTGTNRNGFLTMLSDVAMYAQMPVLNEPLEDQTATTGEEFTYAIPENTFTDPDIDDVLTYNALLADDSALPEWLSFDPATQTFTGTPDTQGDYTIKVTARDLALQTVSDEFELVVRYPVSVNTIAEEGIEVYPNPATEKLYITINNVKQNTPISIVNLNGQVVLQKNLNGNQQAVIDLENFAKGVYFVRILDGKKVSNQKIVIE